jgi:2-oxoisovalerate dehydrogenase E1 component beta subunit
VVFLEHKRTYRAVRGEVPDGDYVVPIGVADIKRAGDAATIVTYGLTLHYSLQAAEVLAAEGVEVEVVDLRTVSPIDRETVLASVRKTSRALVVHEDNLSLGVGAEVSAIIAEHAFDSLDAPVMRVAGPDIPAMPFAPTLEAAYMPTADKIEAALRRLLEY